MTHNPQSRGNKPAELSRRKFVRGLATGVGALALSPILAACGDTTATPAASTTTAATSATTTAAATSATTTAASTTAATTAATATAASTISVPAVIKSATVTIMSNSGDFNKDFYKKFTDANPNITLNVVEDDATRFKAMLAAGTPPDVFRTQGPLIPNLVNRKLLLDLSDYFKASTAAKVDDLAPSANLYVYQNGRYGMPKDWSLDFSLIADTQAFDEAGLPAPSTTTPLTYAEVANLSKSLTKRQGDRTLRVGYVHDLFLVRIIQGILAQEGQKLYKADQSAIVIKDNPLALEVVKYFYDLAKNNYTNNPLNPSSAWGGEDFSKGQVGLIQYGYWYTGMLGDTYKDAPVAGKVVMLPAPVWSGKKRLNPTASGTGYTVAKATKNPDAAWKVFEYFMAGEPATFRAKTGFGIPALKSLYGLMPKETPFQQQVQAVLQDDLKYSDYNLDFNPYYDDSVFGTAWSKYLEQSLRGSMSFEQMTANIESDVNAAVSEGKAKINA